MLTLVVLFSTLLYSPITALNGRGLVALDSASFDKVVSRFDTALVKFDKYYPYGDEHDQFVRISEQSTNASDLIVAEVGVKDYGDNENQDLLERFGLKFDDIPKILLFNKGEHVLTYTGKISVDALRTFLYSSAGVWLPRAGGSLSLDQLSFQLLQLPLNGHQHEEEQLLAAVDGIAAGGAAAELYQVKMLRALREKIRADGVDSGRDMLSAERTRLQKLIAGKLSQRQRLIVNHKLNSVLTLEDGLTGKQTLSAREDL